MEVSEAEICKICAQGKKEKMLALKYVKPGKAQGGPLTQTSAAQPDLSSETLLEQCPFQ